MAFKNLLVHLDSSKASVKRAEAAIAFAAEHGAHLAALAAMPVPTMPSYVEAQIPAAVIEQAQSTLREELAAVGEAFGARAKAAGIGYEFRQAITREPMADLVSRHARYADLTILGQADENDPQTGDPEFAGDVILGSGRPIMMVPYIGAMQPPGRRIMVAWDASREAARAVSDALQLLRSAETVQILIVNPRRGARAHGEEPGADIATHLARHGVKVEVKVFDQRDLSVSDVILARMADEGIDLLVLGAYGHTRLREMVLGGVTRDLLRAMTVPLFMAH